MRGVPLHEDEHHDMATEALMRAVLALFEKIVDLNPNLPEDAYVAAMNEKEPGGLADLVAHVLELEVASARSCSRRWMPIRRLQRLSILLGQELDVLELEDRIHTQVQQEVDKSQREYFLREQMRVIQSELGEGDDTVPRHRATAREGRRGRHAGEVQAKAEKEINRLAAMPQASPEVSVLRTYLDWLLGLPWHKATEDNLDIRAPAEVLDENHYGLPKSQRAHPGAHRRAQAGARQDAQPDPVFRRPAGHRQDQPGQIHRRGTGAQVRAPQPGRRARRGRDSRPPPHLHRRAARPHHPDHAQRRHDQPALHARRDRQARHGFPRRSGIGACWKCSIPEQNNAFSDHYLEVPYDLSKVMFITTANILDPIPPALRDRMEVIEFPGYIEEEKLAIAEQFLVPRQLEEHGLKPGQVAFTSAALRAIIREYTYEAGVRNLERAIANVCRKLARRVAEGKTIPRRIQPSMLDKYLGPPEFTEWLTEETDQIGVANGLAWTEAGGDVMQVEVSVMHGKGSLTLTGQLGEVMQESAQAALTYAACPCRRV